MCRELMRQVTLFIIVLHSRSILKVHSVIEVSSARSYILKVVITMLCYSAHYSKPQYTPSLAPTVYVRPHKYLATYTQNGYVVSYITTYSTEVD